MNLYKIVNEKNKNRNILVWTDFLVVQVRSTYLKYCERGKTIHFCRSLIRIA